MLGRLESAALTALERGRRLSHTQSMPVVHVQDAPLHAMDLARSASMGRVVSAQPTLAKGGQGGENLHSFRGFEDVLEESEAEVSVYESGGHDGDVALSYDSQGSLGEGGKLQ